MRFIALEEHMLPTEIMRACGTGPEDYLGQQYADGLDDLRDGGDTRIANMDAAGIDMQVLSAGATAVQAQQPDLSVELSRRLNDQMADVVSNHPDRFRFFTTLPISDPQASVAELRRGIEELGSVGVMIHGQTNGVFLDDESQRPILAEIERLGVPLYLHPGFAPPPVAEAYYGGLDPRVAQILAYGAWGWHAENGLHVLRMVVNLVFERFPGLQLILGHMGEMLPFTLARADHWVTPLVSGLSTSVAETIAEHVHVTCSGYLTPAPLLCAQMVLGTDRIMFAVDYPYSSSKDTRDFIANAPVSPADREKITHGNAERLLDLG